MKNMNQGAFLCSLRLQLSSCYRVKILVFPLTPKSRIHKSMFPCMSEETCFPACQSCVKTLLGYIVRFLEKRGQGRVFCECWVPYPLLPWLIETVLSDDFSARSGKKTVSLVKLKYVIKTVVERREKWTSVFFWQIWGCKSPTFTGGKYSLCHQAQILRFTKTCFPAVSELCKDNPRTLCTIPWEKSSGESVLWVLSVIPVVTLIRWSSNIRWLPSKEWKAAFSFRKL